MQQSWVMVNGIPGNMGRLVAETVLRRGLRLVPYSLSGADVVASEAPVGETLIHLLKPSDRDARIAQVKAEYPGFLSVDYTHPSAVNGNAEFYVRHQLPFVMGTTGGDRAALMALATKSGLPCVIAPNMAKQIVAFQSLMEMLSSTFPDAFKGYTLSIVESHQKTKADTSGTARAVAESFRKMGFDFDDSKIEMVRDEASQRSRMGVPDSALAGHAFHTYALDSQDGTVHFEFQHNVCGRKVYAEGTVDAVQYLASQIAQGTPARCYSMMDILQAGGMK